MEQHTAIKKMMLTIRVEDIIPDFLFPLIREYLHQMYAVGYDAGYQEINQHGNKPLGQFNTDGKLINIFKSRNEACKFTGYSENGIYKAIIEERPTKHGYYWRYLDEKEKGTVNHSVPSLKSLTKHKSKLLEIVNRTCK